MTDYKEEQCNEVEALESIYPNEFELIEAEPFSKFRIIVKSDEDNKDCDGVALSLIFQYTPNYPDEPPIIEIFPISNIEDADLGPLRNKLEEQCTENLGMAMVFTLVSFSVDWINNKIEADRKKAEEEEELKKKIEEEKERIKFEGTRVTVESFLTWKAKFDGERLELLNKDKDFDKPRKLTGKELFLKDTTLNESDLDFLSAGDDVAVDESLFQDLDDVDLEGLEYDSES